MRVLAILDDKTGLELGFIETTNTDPYGWRESSAHCSCDRHGPPCETEGEALADLLEHLEDHPDRNNIERQELPWPIEF